LRQASYNIVARGPTKPIQGIDRYIHKAARQICLSTKDGSL